jgi:hypothetical protein
MVAEKSGVLARLWNDEQLRHIQKEFEGRPLVDDGKMGNVTRWWRDDKGDKGLTGKPGAVRIRPDAVAFQEALVVKQEETGSSPTKEETLEVFNELVAKNSKARGGNQAVPAVSRATLGRAK